MKQIHSKSDQLSKDQERELKNARRKAVLDAWKREKNLVENGKGTRDWTPEQQKEIIQKNSVRGFEGHHMRSVSSGKDFNEKMEIAGDKNNIQMLEKTKENNEHLKAHNGDTKNRTNGYYNVKTGKTQDFGNGKPKSPPINKLSNPVYKKENENKVSNTENKSREENNNKQNSQQKSASRNR